MTNLTKDDLVVHESEPRVSDRRLADALGFNRVNDLHRLIKAHESELSDFGGVFCFEAKNPSSKGGRPTKSYMLNEHQAVALAMWANTEEARTARMQIINVFVAWRRGNDYVLAQEAQKPDIFQVAADRSGQMLDHLRNVSNTDDLILQLTHLPIWSNGRRPNWWSNLEMRAFLTLSHRQITIRDAVSHCTKRFGAGCVSASSVNRYWMQLDTALSARTAR